MINREQVALRVLPSCLAENYGNDWGKQGREHIPSAVRRAFRIADEFLAQAAKNTGSKA